MRSFLPAGRISYFLFEVPMTTSPKEKSVCCELNGCPERSRFEPINVEYGNEVVFCQPSAIEDTAFAFENNPRLVLKRISSPAIPANATLSPNSSSST